MRASYPTATWEQSKNTKNERLLCLLGLYVDTNDARRTSSARRRSVSTTPARRSPPETPPNRAFYQETSSTYSSPLPRRIRRTPLPQQETDYTPSPEPNINTAGKPFRNQDNVRKYTTGIQITSTQPQKRAHDDRKQHANNRKQR